MAEEEFVSDSSGSGCPNSEPEEPQREAVRLILISSYAGVRETMHSLYQKGFAAVDAWTPVQPAVNYPGEVVTMLVRYRNRQQSDRTSGR